MRKVCGWLVVVSVLVTMVWSTEPTRRALAAGYDTLLVDTDLESPSNVCPTGLDGAVRLTWDASTDLRVVGTLAQYRVVGSETWSDGPSIEVTNSLDVPVVNGLRYEFRVANRSSTGRSTWGGRCLMGWGVGGHDAALGTLGTDMGDLVGQKVAALAHGEAHSCAALETGQVVCWGRNVYGELGNGATGDLGNGTTAPLLRPTFVVGGLILGHRATSIAVGDSHSCAITDDGRVACWGRNVYGQLGDGTTTDRQAPVLVVGGALRDHSAVAIAMGGDHTCAILDTGQVACWGLVNLPGMVTSQTPQLVGGAVLAGHQARVISAGAQHTCVILETGMPACWGAGMILGNGNYPVEIGRGYANDGSTPVAVYWEPFSGHSAVQVVVTRTHACVLIDDGRVACWGYNDFGQVGGERFLVTTPTFVTGGPLEGNRAVSLAAGSDFTCVGLADGQNACWGAGIQGQPGVGFLNNLSRPHSVWGNYAMTGMVAGWLSLLGIWDGTARGGLGPMAPDALEVKHVVNHQWIQIVFDIQVAGSTPLEGFDLELSNDGGETWSAPSRLGAHLGNNSVTLAVPQDGFWTARVRAVVAPWIPPSEWTVSRETEVFTARSPVSGAMSICIVDDAGRPLVGSAVSWLASAGLSSGAGVTDETGTVHFPSFVAGPVGLTLVGGRLGTSSVLLESASVRLNHPVVGGVLRIPLGHVPDVVERRVSVMMRDGTPVPDAALSGFEGGVIGTVRVSRSNHDLLSDAIWNSEGWVERPTSGVSGSVIIRGFDAPSVGADVIANYYEGGLAQMFWAPLTASTNVITFVPMPVVKVVSVSPLLPDGTQTVTVMAVSGSGGPVTNTSLTLTVLAAPAMSRAGALVAASPRLGCAQRLAGRTAANGRVTFVVCPTAVGRWLRASGKRLVASKPVKVGLKPAPTQVAAGDGHSCARTADGGVTCWGANAHGQLGVGSTVASKVPVVVSGLTRVSSVSAGVGFTCAVIAAGAAGVAKCWGADNVGQLGDHATVDALRPHVVTVDGAAALVGVTQVAAGDGYACALLVSRQARCWGRVGGFSNPAPVTVADGTNPVTGVSQIAVGSGSACAVTSTGRVWCWGTNNYGQLGNNSTTPSESAVPVIGINGTNVKAVQVAVGSGYACARMTTGRMRCWGRNTSGQLGNGSTTNTKAPVEVKQNASTPLAGATTITTGTSHACAITVINGLRRVQCWGANNYGQLGDGTTTNRRYPTLVRTGTTIGVTNIAAGNQHTLAVIPYTLRPPTTASAWGRNNTNQLGDNTSLTRVLPTTVTRV